MARLNRQDQDLEVCCDAELPESKTVDCREAAIIPDSKGYSSPARYLSLIRRSIFFILLLLVVGLFAYIYITRFADYPPAQASLAVQAGKATVSHAQGGNPESVNAGARATISIGDVIQASDGATL